MPGLFLSKQAVLGTSSKNICTDHSLVDQFFVQNFGGFEGYAPMPWFASRDLEQDSVCIFSKQCGNVSQVFDMRFDFGNDGSSAIELLPELVHARC